MTGAARRRGAVTDALRDLDHALGRKPDFKPSLDDLADTLHGVSTTLDQLKCQVVLGRIDRADLDPLVQSIPALHHISRELKRLADEAPAAPVGHINQACVLPPVARGHDAR